MTWQTDSHQAGELAKKEGKFILLNFTGSDWCRHCLKLEKELFHSDTFIKYSRTHLIGLKLDFPSKNKNQLSEAQRLHNDSLAELYNPDGTFPRILVLDSSGVIKGEMKYPQKTHLDYIRSIDKIIHP